jgi:hypothetical protein
MSVWTPTMNIPSTGNSGDKNRKRPTLAVLATATLLLAAISLIGVGAIPQPQQAFGQTTVDQSISQNAENSVEDSFVLENTQSNKQEAANVIEVGGDDDDDSTATDANGGDDNGGDEGTSITQSIEQNAENEVENSAVGRNTQSNEQSAANVISVGGNDDD